MTNLSDIRSATSSVRLLDCTLRDGSYEVDFQFTSQDTREIAGRLDALGFPYIEVGHGIGLGASEKVVAAAATDLEYGRAAQAEVVKGSWGMFAIAGVATPEHLGPIADEGMGFIRIGADPNGMEVAAPLVSRAQDLGMTVFLNFMKSYTVKPTFMAELVRIAEDWGVNGVYLVDSAGGMLTHELRAFAEAMVGQRTVAMLGFHGHDNLGLAVANSLMVAESGFDVVDCTLQGLGRSSGNAATEKLVAVLGRLGESRYDVAAVARLGEELVRPRIPIAGQSGLDTYAGYCLFHSSYLPALLEVARSRRIDPYVLMSEHCSVDLVNASETQLDEAADRIVARGGTSEVRLPPDHYVGGDQ
jgi:4-hydroxy-2-oxovalerate aldolase